MLYKSIKEKNGDKFPKGLFSQSKLNEILMNWDWPFFFHICLVTSALYDQNLYNLLYCNVF